MLSTHLSTTHVALSHRLEDLLARRRPADRRATVDDLALAETYPPATPDLPHQLLCQPVDTPELMTLPESLDGYHL